MKVSERTIGSFVRNFHIGFDPDYESEVSLETFGSFVRNFHIGFDHDYECH